MPLDPSTLIQALSPYLRVDRVVGQRLSVYCPYHPVHAPGTERRPSMSIYLESGYVICFTCGHRGWIDQLLRDRGMGQQEARGYSEQLKQTRAPRPVTTQEVAAERGASLSALIGVYQSHLPKNLLDAGFTIATLDHFQVGYDKDHQRVTYPIYDRLGSLIAIVGGAVEPGVIPKYKLYEEEVGVQPGTPQGHRDHLWGFHLLPDTGPYFIVEGYKACMWVHQAGFPVVATQGTSFTETQLEIITSTYRPVVILYDNDNAGQSATERLYYKLIQRVGTTKVRIGNYPRPDPRLQPDGLTQQELAAIWEAT